MTWKRPHKNEYYRRIYRPGLHNPDAIKGLGLWGYAVSTGHTLGMLLDDLKQIFNFVHPDRDHKDVFSHEIRRLLLLACMEVESGFQAVLKANHYSSNQKAGKAGKGKTEKWTRKQYVKLAEPLHLREYKVRFHPFTEYGWLLPFDGWAESNPTHKLGWYDAYNGTKHDREGKLREATLDHVVNAVAAVYIVAAAQFGPNVYRKDQELALPMVEPCAPDYAGEYYDPNPLVPEKCKAIDYQF